MNSSSPRERAGQSPHDMGLESPTQYPNEMEPSSPKCLVQYPHEMESPSPQSLAQYPHEMEPSSQEDYAKAQRLTEDTFTPPRPNEMQGK
jgi:hypothetical protein